MIPKASRPYAIALIGHGTSDLWIVGFADGKRQLSLSRIERKSGTRSDAEGRATFKDRLRFGSEGTSSDSLPVQRRHTSTKLLRRSGDASKEQGHQHPPSCSIQGQQVTSESQSCVPCESRQKIISLMRRTVAHVLVGKALYNRP